MLAILSGFLFNIYFRNRQILQELQLIKEKLGIDKDNSADYKMDNEAIEAELEREHRDPDKNI